MTDFSYDITGPVPPDPTPDVGPTGWPIRTLRSHFGPTMQDERKVANPYQEVSAEQINMTWWQLAGMGITSPQAVILYDPITDGTGVPRIVWGAFTWHQTILLGVIDANFPSFLSITHHAAGDTSLTFTSTVNGRDGAAHPLTLVGGYAVPMGRTLFSPLNYRAEVTQTGNAFRVKTRQAAALAIAPFVLVVY